jgi:hypothetical protein
MGRPLLVRPPLLLIAYNLVIIAAKFAPSNCLFKSDKRIACAFVTAYLILVVWRM